MRATFAGLAIAFLTAVTLVAQDVWSWSMPGNTGVVDDESTWAVALNDAGSASIRSSVPSATIKLRYAVTGGPAQLTGSDPAMCMWFDVRDTGAAAQVIAKLIAFDHGGQQWLLGVFDSDTAQPPLEPSVNYQRRGVCGLRAPQQSPASLLGFDYMNFAYYFEVTLVKTDSSGNPGIRFVGMTGQ
jgi:hypothetical protein